MQAGQQAATQSLAAETEVLKNAAAAGSGPAAGELRATAANQAKKISALEQAVKVRDEQNVALKKQLGAGTHGGHATKPKKSGGGWCGSKNK